MRQGFLNKEVKPSQRPYLIGIEIVMVPYMRKMTVVGKTDTLVIFLMCNQGNLGDGQI